MKLSLSGVWNAYDMQTMNGQSWEATGQEVSRVCPKVPEPKAALVASPPGSLAHPSADEGQHDALIQSQGLSLLHLDALLVQTLHGVPGEVSESVRRTAVQSPGLLWGPGLGMGQSSGHFWGMLDPRTSL